MIRDSTQPGSGDATAAPVGLADDHGRLHTYLRVSVTDRCNLRCLYCMPPGGAALRARAELLTDAEIVRLARVLAGLGISKIRLTGGEPTVRAGLPRLVRRLAELPGVATVALTTNGVRLAGSVGALREAGLAALNISLDTLRRERFRRIAGRDALSEVLAGIDAALAADIRPLKLNVVVMGGLNDDELVDFADFAQARPLEVRFIEFMPFKDNGWRAGAVVTCARMRARLAASRELRPLPAAPADGGAATAGRRCAVAGARGTLSFIAPMSAAFCAGCVRLRLTAAGELKTCLFHPPVLNLRDALRRGAADGELAALARAAVLDKPAARPADDRLPIWTGEGMSAIGG